MKNKTIFFKKWPSSGRLDAHLAKTLSSTESWREHRRASYVAVLESFKDSHIHNGHMHNKQS